MGDMPKKLPPRAQRRAQERVDAKVARDRERLARLEPGGAPAHPIDVESASQVEGHARSMPCVRCGEQARVAEHTAETIDGVRVRVAKMLCPACASRRDIYFRVLTSTVN